VRLREGKQFPYICVTINEPFPRPIVVRQVKQDGNRYFGPIMSSSELHQVLQTLKQRFQLRTCKLRIREGDQQKVCLDYHLGLCPAPCASLNNRSDYLQQVDKACQFLEEKSDGVLKWPKQPLDEAEGTGHQGPFLRDQN
jgi:excinuclease ABC subunit C